MSELQFQISDNFTLTPGSYYVIFFSPTLFSSAVAVPPPNSSFLSSFPYSSISLPNATLITNASLSINSLGEKIYLFSSGTSLYDVFSVGISDSVYSYGTHVTSNGTEIEILMAEETPGRKNSKPLVGPLVSKKRRRSRGVGLTKGEGEEWN